ncbi:MAG: hypothetical protein VXW97_02735 [Pseudomonadota bacterium]|nr:hypothetical protein [Pseudomonadota bacterium]
MQDLKKKNVLFKKLEVHLNSTKINNENIDALLISLKIKKSDFYNLFPKKINDICFYFFENIYNISNKKVKKKVLLEKSISKKTSLFLTELIKNFDSKKKTSIFFLSYAILNPLLLSKIIYKMSSNIWYDIGDQSTDFSYYTKRFILYNIIRNSFFYWRKTLDQKKTINFSERQIMFFGKIGKVKYSTKEFLAKKFKVNFV